MPPAILITQCLQNDFVKPIGRYEALPNLLHVGYDEARRLLGEVAAEGPVARTMRWAYQQPDEGLTLIHIRDWHDPWDARQQAHLKQFGPHCLKDTPGADFVFETSNPGGKNVAIVDSLGLNDFLGTALESLLEPLRDQPAKVGLIGVWTDAKISFLAYELRSRYPQWQLAVCSALTASSSRGQHFIALDQLQKLLGVAVLPSVGQFVAFLGGETTDLPLPGFSQSQPQLEIEGEIPMSPDDVHILRYLFRDSRSVRLRSLDGGFSGNLVLGSESVDPFGHRQVPHVVKIGPQELIGRERASFERIESVLGNSAPRVTDFADWGERGGIKYRYAAMGGGFSSTFQKLYGQGLPLEKIRPILDTVFIEQLGRFYAAGSLENSDLLDYYCFAPDWAPSVRKKVQALGFDPDSPELEFTGGRRATNICRFYDTELGQLPRDRADACYFAYVHGDLNGANIVVDTHENVWLIDFFHTHRGHILRDLIKLENDLLYIFTPVEDEEALAEALALTDALMQVADLGKPLPSARDTGLTRPEFLRAWETLSHLRSFYPDLIQSDRSPLQLWIGMLRYTVHTLSFDESSPLQRHWALYTACRCAEKVTASLRAAAPLRIDWLEETLTHPGRLGLTLLPGRLDYNRNLAADLQVMGQQGVSDIVCLLTESEFSLYGVDALLAAYRENGFAVRHLPIRDQGISSQAEMQELVSWLQGRCQAGAQLLIHCVGGLGRSGTVAACFLKAQGFATEEAITAVRRCRSPRAIETAQQEAFIEGFGGMSR